MNAYTPRRQPVRLGTVQETLLIPLYARAVETCRPYPLLRDPRSLAMVGTIAGDFQRFNDPALVAGAVLRTAIFDDIVARFVAANRGATVVDLGAGLGTRAERLDDGSATWFDVDLPDVVALRRRFFPDTPRRTTIASSLLDPGWTDAIARAPDPHLVVAEGVLMYFAEPEVREALALIAERLPGASVAFDTAAAPIIASTRGEVARGMAARLRWSCDDPRLIECWPSGCRLRESWSLVSLPPAVRRRLPASYRWWLTFLAAVHGRWLGGYRVNVFGAGRRADEPPAQGDEVLSGARREFCSPTSICAMNSAAVTPSSRAATASRLRAVGE